MENSDISMQSPHDGTEVDTEIEQVKSWIASPKSNSFEETMNYNILTMVPPKTPETSGPTRP